MPTWYVYAPALSVSTHVIQTVCGSSVLYIHTYLLFFFSFFLPRTQCCRGCLCYMQAEIASTGGWRAMHDVRDIRDGALFCIQDETLLISTTYYIAMLCPETYVDTR